MLIWCIVATWHLNPVNLVDQSLGQGPVIIWCPAQNRRVVTPEPWKTLEARNSEVLEPWKNGTLESWNPSLNAYRTQEPCNRWRLEPFSFQEPWKPWKSPANPWSWNAYKLARKPENLQNFESVASLEAWNHFASHFLASSFIKFPGLAFSQRITSDEPLVKIWRNPGNNFATAVHLEVLDEMGTLLLTLLCLAPSWQLFDFFQGWNLKFNGWTWPGFAFRMICCFCWLY